MFKPDFALRPCQKQTADINLLDSRNFNLFLSVFAKDNQEIPSLGAAQECQKNFSFHVFLEKNETNRYAKSNFLSCTRF